MERWNLARAGLLVASCTAVGAGDGLEDRLFLFAVQVGSHPLRDRLDVALPPPRILELSEGTPWVEGVTVKVVRNRDAAPPCEPGSGPVPVAPVSADPAPAPAPPPRLPGPPRPGRRSAPPPAAPRGPSPAPAPAPGTKAAPANQVRLFWLPVLAIPFGFAVFQRLFKGKGGSGGAR